MIKPASTTLITAARRCLGTPFHHQGRAPGVGLDCIGLVVVALRDIGITVQDRQDYGRRPDGATLIDAIESHGTTRITTITAGNILVFRYDNQPQHVAFATGPDSMIHAFAPARRVVETALGVYWHRRLLAVYELNLR